MNDISYRVDLNRKATSFKQLHQFNLPFSEDSFLPSCIQRGLLKKANL